ncbi:MAG: OprO/OprP family phosphate-selective porin [Flavobacteriaceae bacterium]|nr:OprO/OprP family phosphate-selective porin [Flavobacteriaceae bacterium]
MIFIVKHILLIAFTFLLFFSVSAQDTTNTKFGKGMINLVAKDSSWSVKFAPRIQFLTSANWKNEDGSLGDANTNFLIRRARLKFSGFAYSPKLRYKLELGLSNRDVSGGSKYTGNTPRIIMDAVVKWNFYKNFVLWAGQTKLPGNVERVVSSANLQLVDRSILNARFNIDRDIGFQLRHHFNLTEKFVIREIFAFSQGEGRNVVSGNEGGLQYTGRLEFLPFGTFKSRGDYKGSDLKREQMPKLAVSVSYDFNNNAVKTRSNMGLYMETDLGLHETNISTTFVDAMFKYRGFSIMTEFANRIAEDPIARNEDGSETGLSVQEGYGFNFMSGYLFKNNWEVTGRYSIVDLKNKDASGQYTLGFSKYIVGHKLKVQTDITYLSIAGINDGLLYRLQLDVHF